jgi:hypothetical protein
VRARIVLLVLVAVATAFPGGATAAWALARPGPVAAKARALGAGSTPNASVTGRKVTVSWTASSFTTGGAVPGYVVRRYNATTGVGTAALNGCSGTITGLTCTENSVPTGSWQYTVTPAAGNWRGTESGKSTVVVVI